MWFRSSKSQGRGKTADAAGTPFGIGVQVHVVDGATGESFADEPTGLIVGTGSVLPHRGVTQQTEQARVWVVQFDEPQNLRDGRGPFARAEISEESLVVAPPLDGEPDQSSAPDHASGPDRAEEPGQEKDSGQERGTTTPFS